MTTWSVLFIVTLLVIAMIVTILILATAMHRFADALVTFGETMRESVSRYVTCRDADRRQEKDLAMMVRERDREWP